MEASVNGAAQSIAGVLTGASVVLIAFAVLVRMRRDKPGGHIARRLRRVALLYRFMRMRKPSLLERMIDKGSLTLSIDKGLWAVAGIIAALKVPTALAAVVQFARIFGA
jgi:hypothetical protein